ncbi:MAG: RsmE family RNA methyltransferase [Chitinophagales bacterium]
MQLFYTPHAASGAIVALEEQEAHHAQVVRLQSGDAIHLMDGKGKLYVGRLVELTRKTASVQIGDCIQSASEPSSLHIAIAPTKNIDRMEWFCEKVTELGVAAIYPIICQRSERKELRNERLEKVILSAAKQSQSLFLPKLFPAQTFRQILTMPFEGTRCIAECAQPHVEFSSLVKAGQPHLIMIGPEGDFTPEETSLALTAGFQAVSLGASRLRTETAGIYAAAILRSAG